MFKYLIFLLFLLFTFSFSVNLRVKIPEASYGYCSSSDQVVYLEPKSQNFQDQTKTFGLVKSFFLGTGEEVHFRAHGKFPALNLIFREKWCVNVEKGMIRNAVTGLYLKRITVSSGGAAMLAMTRTASSDWEIVKIQTNVYILVSKLLQRDNLKKALVPIFDVNGKAVLTMAEFKKEKEEQMWVFNKV